MFKAFFKTILSVRATIIIYYVIFLSFAIASAKNQEKNPIIGDFEDKVFEIAVVDCDNSEASKLLYNYLDQTQKIVDMGTDDIKTLNDYARFDMVEYVLIINEGFEDKLVSGNLEGALSYEVGESKGAAYALSTVIENWTNNVAIYLSEGESLDDAASAATNIATDVSSANIKIIAKNTKSSDGLGIVFFFKMAAYALAMVITLSLGMTFAKFKTADVESRISVAPESNRKRKIDFYLASIIFSILVAVPVMVIAVSMYKQQASVAAIGLYFVNLIASGFVYISLAMLIETFTHNDGIMNMIANGLILSQCFICGVFVTRQILSPKVVNVSKFFPFYWNVNGVELVSKYGSISGHVGEYFLNIGMQLMFALIIFVAAILASRTKGKKAL